MASNRIKGITIEIGGDTTGLQKALSSVDSSLKNTQKSLSDVNKLLKLDPKNTELLKQKQDLLKSAIADTNERLNTLREAYKQLDGAKTEEAKEQQKALAREIVDTEQKLESLEKESRNFGSVFSQQLKSVGEDLKQVGDKLQGVGKDLSMKLTAPIVALGTIGVNYNAQVQQYQAALTTITGSAEEADRVIKQVTADASKTSFGADALIEANQYLLSAGINADESMKTILALGDAVAATGGGNAELSRMAQNLQQIQNTGKATSMDIKQFANAGINVYGLLSDYTGKSVEELQDMDITYETLSAALQQAASEGGRYYGAMESQSQTLTGSINILKDSVTQLLGELTETLTPIITEVIGKIQSVVKWLSGLDSDTKKRILLIAGIAAALGPVLLIIGKLISMVGTITSAISFLATPIGGVTLLIAGLVAAGVALYKNWDTIKQKLADLKNKFVNTWNSIKSTFSNAWTNIVSTAKSKVDSVINAIKGLVDKAKSLMDFHWELPKLKLPHITWTSEPLDSSSWTYKILDALGLPTSLPKMNIEWYRKAMSNGMILNNPTIFGAMDGRLLGAGESGSETIVGTNSLMGMIQQAVGSNGMTVNMTVNGGSISANELADIVIDKLTNRIQRNNQRW